MALGNRAVSCIASGLFVHDFLDDGGRNSVQMGGRFQRNSQGIDPVQIIRLNPLPKIGLVEEHEQFFLVMGGDEIAFGGRHVLGSINEADAQIGIGEGASGAANTFLFDFARSIAQSCGIDDFQRVALEGNGLLDGVARGAGVGGDDGAVAAGQEIEQGGFADVRGAGDDDAGAFAQNAAFLPGGQQGVDFVGNGGQAINKSIRNRLRQFIIRKIEHGLDVRRDGQEGIVERADASAKGILELGGGEARCAFGTGLDEIQDGFGLSQIEFAVQKSAFGEFAGFGLACAGGQEGLQNAASGLGSAVALDFGGIFAGERVRGAENEQQGIVEDFAGGRSDDLSVDERSGGALGRRRGGTAENPIGDGECAGARKADDRDGAGARSGGDGGDDVGWE